MAFIIITFCLTFWFNCRKVHEIFFLRNVQTRSETRPTPLPIHWVAEAFLMVQSGWGENLIANFECNEMDYQDFFCGLS